MIPEHVIEYQASMISQLSTEYNELRGMIKELARYHKIKLVRDLQFTICAEYNAVPLCKECGK